MSGTWLQVLNSLSFAGLLFIVASGFTLIFGLLRVVNLAHGSLYLLGGYIGMTAAVATGSFAVGAVAAAIAIAFTGLVLDRGLLNFVKNQELKQVLLTLGVALVLNDLALVLWGGDTRTIPIPEFLQGAAQFGEIFYPKYRLMVLAGGVIIFLLLWLLYNCTRLGAMIRAGVDDAEMVEAIGIDIRRLFLLTFMLGSALAGLGGVLGGAFLTLYPSADSEILVYSLAIVIIGGRGSLAGAAIGSLMVGFLATFGQIWFPELAYFVIFGPMALLLAFRPLGLFGGLNVRILLWILLAVSILFLLGVPFLLSAYPKTLATEALILGLFAMSIDILAGIAGRTPLGHGSIFGVAAYVVAHRVAIEGANAWTGMLLGLLASVAVAALFGALAVRTSGVYFLLLTLAQGMIVWGICYRWTSVTGAENGIRGVDRPELIASPNTFYYFVLFAVAISALLIWRLVHSPFGMALRGIRESPSRMRTLGYNVPLTLTIAFTLSGFFAGVAGILFVFLNNFISPNNVALSQSVSGLLMVVLGGVGTLWGAFVGSAVMISLENLVSAYTERWPTILGLMFILTMLFASEGLVGKAKLIVQKRLANRSSKSV